MEAERRRYKEMKKKLLPAFLAQIMLSLALAGGVLYGGYYLCDSIPYPKSSDLADKLVYFVRCCVFPCAVMLLVAIMSVVGRRAEGTAPNPLGNREHLIQLEKNILSNTVEQSFLFLMICLTLTTYLEDSEMQILPVYSILWVVSRVLFIVGYKIDPKYRSLGMVTIFICSFFFIGLTGYLMYTRGFMYGVGSVIRGSSGKVPVGGAGKPLNSEL